MKKKYLFTVVAVGLFASSQNIWAACSIGTQMPQKLDLAFGTIAPDPKLAIGAVISSRNFSLAQLEQVHPQCDSSGGMIKAEITGSQLTSFAHVYRTNIKGVGIRFLQASQSPVNFPFQTPVQSNIKQELGQQLTVELVKTENVIGSGPLAANITTHYYLDADGPSRPFLTTQLQANSTVLNHPTCGFSDQSINQTVNMGTLRSGQLTAVGATAGEKQFTVGFVCSPGHVPNYVSVKFDYQRDADAINPNVVKNSTAEGFARGVGIALQVGSPFYSPLVASNTLGYSNYSYLPEIRLSASYYQTLPKITPGQVYATMTMSMTYQ